MTYCLYWKHADEIVKHESFIDALFDYIDCIDNRGLELWWEESDARVAWIRDPVFQCECVAPSSTLRDGRWICDACDGDTDLFADDEKEDY